MNSVRAEGSDMDPRGTEGTVKHHIPELHLLILEENWGHMTAGTTDSIGASHEKVLGGALRGSQGQCHLGIHTR